MKLLAAFIAAEIAVTYLALTETVQAALIAAIASLVNTVLLLRFRREQRAQSLEVRRIRRATSGRRRQTREADDVLIIEVPEGLD